MVIGRSAIEVYPVEVYLIEKYLIGTGTVEVTGFHRGKLM
jgi:hypothetical protein